MTRTVTALALSLSIFMTSLAATAAPARADSEDVAKVLTGLAVLGIIAAAIDKRNEKKATRTQTHRPVVAPRPVPVRKVAPRRCLREQWTHRGTRLVYGAKCMKRHANANPPRTCLREADINNGPRYFYTKRCLRKRGWRI